MSGTSEGPTPAADLDRSAVTDSDHTTYHRVFAAAPLAMAVVDGAGLVAGANAAFGELLGADPDTLTGRVAADLVDLASDARSWHAYREVLCGQAGEAALHPCG